MARDPSPDLELAPINGKPHTVQQWLTTFHLVIAGLDPFSHQSAWIVDAAGRILTTYEGADCRVAFLVGGTPSEARDFLGHWSNEVLTFADPDLVAVRGFGFEVLPAIVHLGMDGTVVNACEGWEPPCWRALTEDLSRMVGWKGPVVPGPADPAAFAGAPLEPA